MEHSLVHPEVVEAAELLEQAELLEVVVHPVHQAHREFPEQVVLMEQVV
jgi:hypothetical protein